MRVYLKTVSRGMGVDTRDMIQTAAITAPATAATAVSKTTVALPIVTLSRVGLGAVSKIYSHLPIHDRDQRAFR